MKGTDDVQLDGFLPLKPAVFLVLLSLAEEEQHGYALAGSVRSLSGGKLTLATGPLYRHLQRMLDEGLVEESDRRPAPDQDDRRRRDYRLTALGREVVAAEAERMADLVAVSRSLELLGAQGKTR
jgi:DNA-binding PadR family transcriptional regulator